MLKKLKKIAAGWLLAVFLLTEVLFVHADDQEESASEKVSISAPSAILMESTTGQVIYEKNAHERRSPASVTKVMTMLLAMEALDEGKVSLKDEVITSEHAASMGGSQVYLEAGEIQTFEVLLKCIAVASGNDASVAVAEHISGSEVAFVDLMNKRAAELGMKDTHFMDCCGLSDSDEHYTTAQDIAVMSRELTVNFPEIYEYTQIWMEDITHVTARGSSAFTLSSTNKLLKWYPYTTGLKTGSTSKAKYCISATAQKDDLHMIAVIMGAEDPKTRFLEAQALLAYGFGVSKLYVDEHKETLPLHPLEGSIADQVSLKYEDIFRYLDVTGKNLANMEKILELPEVLQAPLEEGQIVGKAVYRLDGEKIGEVNILSGEDAKEAKYPDYLLKVFEHFLLGESMIK
jgi:D-alanyl-D-alanine carboxypeptidase (penicillin-binding protein 5/6)